MTLGWQGIKNGELLAKVEAEGFEVLVTADKNMPYQQSMAGRGFALLILDIHPNILANQATCVPLVESILPAVRPGAIHQVAGPHPKRNST